MIDTENTKISLVAGIYLAVREGQTRESVRTSEECEDMLKNHDGMGNMPCGNYYSYHSPADIPLESVSCPCGDPTHWLVYWQDEQN